MMPPNVFVPLFEKDGLIVRLDTYILRRVCAYQAKRREQGLPLVPISVNMSRTTLYHPDTLNQYRSIMEEAGLSKELVPIEITESAALLNNQIRDRATRLKEAGFVLHMDDFGAGYSSLTSLVELPFDVIKLDKSLTDSLVTRKGQTIVRHIIDVVHELGMSAVAEGVETKEEDTFLLG